ncbi:MAG: iron-containing alcohol dehydrogenase [Solirubrobacterales bacterium]
MASADHFTWHDGERTIVFGAGAFAESPDLVGGPAWERFELLTTPRALGAAPIELAERSSAVHQVPGGGVPEAAAAIIGAVRTPTLVALGGGRVIDVAKAIAAVRGGRVCAMPTTLSGAEMTTIHRLPAGREDEARRGVRPILVVADPAEMTSLGEARLRASAMNAVAHGAEALYGPLANPLAILAALHGVELIARALDSAPADRDRTALALGSLLCAHALDSAGFALHHVVCQTLVRELSIPHGETNATMLPRTMAAMRPRAPEAISALAGALGTTPGRIVSRLQTLGGGRRRLGDLGADRGQLEAAVSAILERPDLANTPDPPDRVELEALLDQAW